MGGGDERTGFSVGLALRSTVSNFGKEREGKEGGNS